MIISSSINKVIRPVLNLFFLTIRFPKYKKAQSIYFQDKISQVQKSQFSVIYIHVFLP